VEALTGVGSGQWLSLFTVVGALALAASALRRREGQVRLGRVALLPLIGAAGFLTVAVLGGHLSPQVFRALARPVNIGVLVGAAVVAVALVDLLYARALPALASLLSRIGPARPYRYDLALALLLVPAVIGADLIVARQTAAPEQHGLATVEAFELPGDPMGIVMRTASAGYASLGEGMVIAFELPSAGGTLATSVVADGFEYTRGLAIAAGRLYVADIVDLPCDPAFPSCTGLTLNPDDYYAGEAQILRAARGRLVSFAIAADGSLTDRRTDLEGLPVAGSEHGLNGVETGPDGAIYLSIGNVGELASPSTEMTPHPEWLGTVLRLDPATNAVEIFASGLRNVYELAFDAQGELWGIDNDGTVHNGFRGEEVLQIKQGGNHGYPADGSFGTRTIRDVEPVWIVDTNGTAGLAWAEGTSLGPGLLYGSCNGLDFLGLYRRANGEPTVGRPASQGAVQAKLLEVPGCIVTVTVLPDGSALVGVFAFTGHGSLMRLTFTE